MLDLVTFFMILHEISALIRFRTISEAKRIIKKWTDINSGLSAGSIRSVKGWMLKMIICCEMAAGREHLKNYQSFSAGFGVLSIIEKNRLLVGSKKITTWGRRMAF